MLLALVCLGTACSTAPVGDVVTSDEWAQKVGQLRRGMSMEAVRALFGEPEIIKPFAETRVDAQRWVYRDRTVVNSTMQATGSRDVPYYDPFTRTTRMIPEPTYSQVDEAVIRELHLLWANGELMRWQQKQEQKSKVL